MRYLLLTEPNDEPILINMFHVIKIKPSYGGSALYLANCTQIQKVLETPKEIKEMLEDWE